jgi:hypothetical protein
MRTSHPRAAASRWWKVVGCADMVRRILVRFLGTIETSVHIAGSTHPNGRDAADGNIKSSTSLCQVWIFETTSSQVWVQKRDQLPFLAPVALYFIPDLEIDTLLRHEVSTNQSKYLSSDQFRVGGCRQMVDVGDCGGRGLLFQYGLY